MSGRSTRRRSKTTRALEAEEQAEIEKVHRNSRGKAKTPLSNSRTRTPVQKPKYLSETSNGGDRSVTPSSRASSRAASPATSSRSSRRRSSIQKQKTPSSVKSRSKRSTSGSNTPISRASRSSSVTSNGTARKPIPKLKLKNKLGRGYNPSLVNYKESEYHYGSDFEEKEDEYYVDDAESEKSSELSDENSLDGDSDDLKVESDVDIDEIVTNSLPETPMPFWLREEEEFPDLKLPNSSEDLLISNQYVINVFSIYEILRRFHQILRLTPFRVEDFCAAIASDEQSNLLSEIHIALLRHLIRAEENNGTTFGPIDLKDSINSSIFFTDSVTWPESLISFLTSDPAYEEPLKIVRSCEYPFSSSNDEMIENRLKILNFLTDQVLLTPVIRDFIIEDGSQPNEEHCRVCHRLGEMLVCETCPGVFHLGCLDPPLIEVPEEEWRCYICIANEVDGVYDCRVEQKSSHRHESLGIDRNGNKYWFLCRRLVVEMQNGDIRYYSTVKQLEELSEVLDDELYEKELWESMEQIRIEMERQMDITETITMSKKSGSKKSYFEVENAAIEKLQKDREEKDKPHEVETKMETDETDVKKEDPETVIKTEETEKTSELDKSEKLLASEKTNESIRLANETLGEVRVTRKTLHELNSGTLYFKLGQEGTYKTYVNQYTTKFSALSKQQSNEERLKKQHMSHKFSLTDASTFKWVGNLYGNRNLLINTLRHTMLQCENSVPQIFMHPNWHLLRKAWTAAVGNSVTPKDFSRALTVLNCCMKPSILLNVWYDALGHTQFKKITTQQKEDKKKIEKRERREREEEEEKLRPFMTFVKYTLGLKHQVSKQKGEEYRAHGQFGWLWISSCRYFSPSDSSKLGLKAGPYRLAVKYSDIRDGTQKVVLMEPKAFEYFYSKQEEIDGEQATEKAQKEGEESQNTDSSVTEKKEENKQFDKKRLEEALKNARLERQQIPKELFEEVVNVCEGLHNPTRVLYPKVAKKGKVLDDFLFRRQQLKTLEEKRIKLKLEKQEEENKNSSSSASNEIKDEKPSEESIVDVEGESESKTSITSSLAATDNKDKEGKDAFIVQSKKSIWVMIGKLKELLKNSSDKTESDEIKTDSQEESKTENNADEVEVNGEVKQESEEENTQVTDSKSEGPLSENEISTMNEALSLYKTLTSEARTHGLDVPKAEEDLKFSSLSDTVLNLQNFVKLLMTKKEEYEKYSVIGISTVTEKNSEENKLNGKDEASVKSENDIKDNKEVDSKENEPKNNIIRVYSNQDTSLKLYLKRIQSIAESKKQTKVVKYPLTSSFYSKSRKKKNILILSKHDLKHLARKAGYVYAEGFNYNSKPNQVIWPYPCPRPTFKTAWLYRTSSLNSLHTVALQLRVLWASIRWDDMTTRPFSIDGKHQQTTESAVTTTELLKHRNVGRFQEITEYFQRKSIVPIGVPKSTVEVAPIRSGLRKRKRAESPQYTEPKVTEEWIPESKLDLWEIRAYRERLEREKTVSLTRSRTGTLIKEPQRLDPSSDNKKIVTVTSLAQSNTPTRTILTKQIQSPAATNLIRQTVTPTIIRKIINADGTISLVKSTVSAPTAEPVSASPQQTKKVFISKDGKIIGAQVIPTAPPQQKVALTPISMAQSPIAGTSGITTTSTPNKVQIIRSSDGNIQVRGLLPNQQLVQTPDGKLQVMNKPTPSPTVLSSTGQQIVSTPINSPGVFAQKSPAPISGSPQVALSSPASSQQKPVTPQTPKQIYAQILPPGSPVPKGMTAFTSKGKTYCIPSSATNLLRQHANTTQVTQPTTPIVAPPQPQTQAITPTTTVKQPIEMRSLGANTVTYKGQQMIVSGPDVKEAQNIANLLSTGQAKLATLNGKQILVSPQAISTGTSLNATNVRPLASTPAPSTTAVTPSSSNLTTTNNDQNSLDTSSTKENVNNDQKNSPLKITAQLLQTNQGPRIVLQGIQGASLAQSDLAIIQQLVKTQLLKAQSEAKREGKIPPTKIQVELPQSIQANLKKEPPVADETTLNENKNHNEEKAASNIVTNPPKMLVVSQSGGQKIIGLASTQQVNTNLVPIKTNVVSSSDNASPVFVNNAVPNTESENIHGEQGKPISDILGALNPLPATQVVNQPAKEVELPKTPIVEEKTEEKKENISELDIPEENHDNTLQQIDSELHATLFKQKEILKKAIARKRSHQEKELQRKINGEVETIKQIQQLSTTSQEDEENIENDEISSTKRPRKDSEPSIVEPPAKKKRRRSSTKDMEDKVFCICKTKYDPTQFYVGCDVCKEWFHGSCVGITEAMSKDMSEFICDSCQLTQSQTEQEDIFCICKQPYDESLFYIGCEKCSDWFHGRCVGILQSEAENIDEYHCPNCDPDSDLNKPNIKELNEEDYDLIKKLFKQILSNRYSASFKKPVDRNDVPNYYKVVKEPMDLQTIENRINEQHYRKLSEFVGDVTRIFENCRLFNQPDSHVSKCADGLESFFAQKLVLLREKILSQSPP